MLNYVQASERATVPVFSFHDESLTASPSTPFPLADGSLSSSFPITPEESSEQGQHADRAEAPNSISLSAVALDAHPRESAWAGLAEAGQILCEAEAHKGEALNLSELHALMVAHLDAYNPDWHFGRAGISDAWMSGWEHAFALYAQQITRLCDPEPIHGIGLVFRPRQDSFPTNRTSQRQTVRFGKARLQVADPDTFWQGVQEGQVSATDEQDEWQELRARWSGEKIRSLTTARYFDDLLDLVYETGNHGLDFVVGYVLGKSVGLFRGRRTPLIPAKMPSA